MGELGSNMCDLYSFSNIATLSSLDLDMTELTSIVFLTKKFTKCSGGYGQPGDVADGDMAEKKQLHRHYHVNSDKGRRILSYRGLLGRP